MIQTSDNQTDDLIITAMIQKTRLIQKDLKDLLRDSSYSLARHDHKSTLFILDTVYKQIHTFTEEVSHQKDSVDDVEILSVIRYHCKHMLEDSNLICKQIPDLSTYLNAAVATPLGKLGDRLAFCSNIRAAFEKILTALLARFNIESTDKGSSPNITERVILLKPFIKPNSRLNCFFDLKEYSSVGSHAQDNAESVSLRLIELTLCAFRLVIGESTHLFTQPAPAPKVVENEGKLPWNYKTVMCKFFTSKGYCNKGESCQFAHGQKELRKITETNSHLIESEVYEEKKEETKEEKKDEKKEENKKETNGWVTQESYRKKRNNKK